MVLAEIQTMSFMLQLLKSSASLIFLDAITPLLESLKKPKQSWETFPARKVESGAFFQVFLEEVLKSNAYKSQEPSFLQKEAKTFWMSATDTKGSGQALLFALAMAKEVNPNTLEEAVPKSF